MRKQLLAFVLIFIVIFAFSGCNKIESVISDIEEKISIDTNIFQKDDTDHTEPKADNSSEFEGHRYMYVDTPMTWSEAKAYCENKKGYLVTINSAEENKFVSSLGKSDNPFWIGANSSSGLRWVNGEKNLYTQALEYGDPALAAIYIASGSDGFWTNYLEREMCFVCEWGSYESDHSTTHRQKNLNLYANITGMFTLVLKQ